MRKAEPFTRTHEDVEMDPASKVQLVEKVAFLADVAAYPHVCGEVRAIETHMAWVFLAGDYAYKLKKPVTYPFLDYSTLDSREFACREETRLNTRLAPGIYLGAVPLFRLNDGTLSLTGPGETVDWLVKMRRLPDELMLDHAIASGAVTPQAVNAVVGFLAAFYRRTPSAPVAPETLSAAFRREHEKNAELLLDARFDLDHRLTGGLVDHMERAINEALPLLGERALEGRILEGHGDLRPEHVCLSDPPVIIDCLEFSHELRLIDPYDEISFLGLECERLEAKWIDRQVHEQFRRAYGNDPPLRLICFYRAAKAMLRARQALAHLTERHPRTPAKWQPRAREYLALAHVSLVDFDRAGH